MSDSNSGSGQPPFRDFRERRPGGLRALQLHLLESDIMSAAREYVNSLGRYPTSVNDLLNHKLISFTPKKPDGSPMPFRDIAEGDKPGPDEVCVRIAPPRIIVLLPSEEPSLPPFESIHWHIGDCGPADVPLSPINLDDVRVELHQHAIHAIIQCLFSCYGAMPDSFEEALDAFQVVPLNFGWKHALPESGSLQLSVVHLRERRLGLFASPDSGGHWDPRRVDVLPSRSSGWIGNIRYDYTASPDDKWELYFSATLPSGLEAAEPPPVFERHDRAGLAATMLIRQLEGPGEICARLGVPQPASADELLAHHQLFHLPLTPQGQPCAVISRPSRAESAGDWQIPSESASQDLSALSSDGLVLRIIGSRLRGFLRMSDSRGQFPFDGCEGVWLVWTGAPVGVYNSLAAPGYAELHVRTFCLHLLWLLRNWVESYELLPERWENLLATLKLGPHDYAIATATQLGASQRGSILERSEDCRGIRFTGHWEGGGIYQEAFTFSVRDDFPSGWFERLSSDQAGELNWEPLLLAILPVVQMSV